MKLTGILILLVICAVISIGCFLVWDRRKMKLLEEYSTSWEIVADLLRYERNARCCLVMAFFILGLATPFMLVKLFY